MLGSGSPSSGVSGRANVANVDLNGSEAVVIGVGLRVTEVRERGIPLAMLLPGGYSSQSSKIHADAIEGILTRFDRA
jgi:hypothetical protein